MEISNILQTLHLSNQGENRELSAIEPRETGNSQGRVRSHQSEPEYSLQDAVEDKGCQQRQQEFRYEHDLPP